MAPLARYTLVAANAPRLAADIVAAVREGCRIRLDYSPGSLLQVDRVIGGIRRELPPREAVADPLLGFGAYLGEVLVRTAGAEWVDFDDVQQLVFGHPFGLRTPDARTWDPLSRAAKRYDDGPAHSLHRFYLAATARPRH